MVSPLLGQGELVELRRLQEGSMPDRARISRAGKYDAATGGFTAPTVTEWPCRVQPLGIGGRATEHERQIADKVDDIAPEILTLPVAAVIDNEDTVQVIFAHGETVDFDIQGVLPKPTYPVRRKVVVTRRAS